MNKRKLVTYRGDYDMEDKYKVSVTMGFSQTGHNDEKFPDTEMGMKFDATDANIETMCLQFEILLKSMGYIFDGRHLEMVDGDAL